MSAVDEQTPFALAHRPLPTAPGADRYVSLDFANTVGQLAREQAYDLLPAPEATQRWLASHDLSAPDVQLHDACVQDLRTLRGHVRALFTARTTARMPPAQSLDAVNKALMAAPTAPTLQWDEANGPHRVQVRPTPGQVLTHALAVLSADAADLLAGPDSDRLATCGSAPCNRFLLRTHGRRHWCSTRCGDRARAARAQARRSAT
ncbi:CGNR zinc finger domain-containing protein [Streptomyces sp. OP7]|uniref:CGNR zinc finger domain-containing protein n=1 Tax=Streptomyces sp. OP7 TaxID=3142462 RepID=UPI0032E8D0A2